METYPTTSINQPDDDGGFAPNVESVERDHLVNYSEKDEFIGRDAAEVALEVFGVDLSRSGMFFTEAARDLDVPYLVVCEGHGRVTSYNLFDGGRAAARGLNGFVITEADAEQLRASALGPR